MSAHLCAGIVAPVKPYQEGGENTRLGVGKIEQDEEYTNADKVSRKRLEVEIQADEDEDRVKRREVIKVLLPIS